MSAKRQSLQGKYRPDIDGLRAIAVLAVVMYHIEPTWIRGGFVGVDVFFVISGYLITGIVLDALKRGDFSLTDFYIRRILRIFPALLVVLAFCLVFGWAYLLAFEYEQLGKHIAAGAGFVGNLVFWSEAGYFDTSAGAKPLLHLWSLGIEEQFYLAWPAILWIGWILRVPFVALMLVLGAGSFFLNIMNIDKDPTGTFFSPATRAWELMAGALLAWLHYRQNGSEGLQQPSLPRLTPAGKFHVAGTYLSGQALTNFASTIGFTLLIIALWRINKGLEYPGKWAILPVLASLLILAAGPKAVCNRLLLSNPIVVWIGLISYPLYLWHWPLLSFTRILGDGSIEKKLLPVVFFASILLAWITYRLVENPIRRLGSNRHRAMALVISMVVVGVSGLIVFHFDGVATRAYEQRFSSYTKSMVRADKTMPCFFEDGESLNSKQWSCPLGSSYAQHEQLFVLGDSHGLSLIPALDRFGKEHGRRMDFSGMSGCPPLLGIHVVRKARSRITDTCSALNEKVFEHVQRVGIKRVILIGRWVYYSGSLSRPHEHRRVARDDQRENAGARSSEDMAWAFEYTMQRYASIGVQVIFVKDNPQQLYRPSDIIRKGEANDLKYRELSVSAQEHADNQRFINDKMDQLGARSINFDHLLCDHTACPLTRFSKFLYFDDDHLSVAGAIEIYPAIVEKLLE